MEAWSLRKSKIKLAGVVQYTINFRKIKSRLDFPLKVCYFLLDQKLYLFIIAPSDKPRWQRTVPVYRALAGMGVPKDIVWWTPDEIAEWDGVKSHFINTALREGKVLHESKTALE